MLTVAQWDVESNKLRALLDQTQHQLEASRVEREKETAALNALLTEVCRDYTFCVEFPTTHHHGLCRRSNTPNGSPLSCRPRHRPHRTSLSARTRSWTQRKQASLRRRQRPSASALHSPSRRRRPPH